MTTNSTIKLGFITRLGLVIGSAVLIIGGAMELPVQSGSSEYKSYFEESSFAALSLRSQGGLKLGLGIALLGTSAIGVGTADINAWMSKPESIKTK